MPSDLVLQERECCDANCRNKWGTCWAPEGQNVSVCFYGTCCAPCVYSAAWERVHNRQQDDRHTWWPQTPNGCVAMCLLCTHDCALPLFGSYIRTHDDGDTQSARQCWYLFVAMVPCWFCGPCEMAAAVMPTSKFNEPFL